jgi:hypothetical protein
MSMVVSSSFAFATHAALALVSLELLGCGSHVLVAEERPDAGDRVADADAARAERGVFTCGTTRCTDHPTVVAGVTLNGYACCHNAKRSACGVIELDTCVPLDQPGHPDPSCQPVTSTLFGVLPGCCTPTGSCGSFESNIGIGCIQIPLVTPPMNCTY